jgi:hypothetical protein
MRRQFSALFAPENLALTGGVIAAWGAAQFVGAGEVVDAVLVFAGVVTVGWQAGRCAQDLTDYVRIAAAAQTEAELDSAADHLARAVVEVGVAAFLALVMKAGARLGRGGSPAAGEEAGAWWKVYEEGENFPGTAVPRGFKMEVRGRTFRVTSNACEHMVERLASRVKNPSGYDGPAAALEKMSGQRPPGNTWPRQPFVSEVDYPLSSLAGALEQAAKQLEGKAAGRHFFTVGNWELGIDTADSPWAVYHAQPLTQ